MTLDNTQHATRFTFHVSRFTFHVSRFTFQRAAHWDALRSSLFALRSSPRLLLFAILGLFTLFTLYQSIVLPLGEADDETDHYQYLRFVARTGHPPLTEAERGEAGFKGGLAPLYYWLTAWPVALVGEQSQPDIRRVDARPERLIPGDGLGINHVLHTLDESWPWRGQVLAWHLVRFLSLPLGWLTILATYGLARRLEPGRPAVALGAAAFVALLPRFVGSSAVINDDNLVFALTALLLLVQVTILQAPLRASRRLFAAFGALFGLALVTKYFSLILIPEIVFTIISYQLATNKQFKTHNSKLIIFFLALALTAGPWFIFILLRFNRVEELGLLPGLAASLGEPQVTEGLVGLLAGHSVRPVAATYSLPAWFSLLYRSFWFEYGWMQVFAPNWVYWLFSIFLLGAAAGRISELANRRMANKRMTNHSSQFTIHNSLFTITLFLLLHTGLFVAVVLMRYVLSATIDTGQGRHLYPALPVIAVWLAAGLAGLRQGMTAAQRPPTAAERPPTTDRRPPNPPTSNLHPSIPPSSILHPPSSILYPLSSILHPLSSILYPLSSLCYLLPALLCLLPGLFVLPHYRTVPVTINPPDSLPIVYRQVVNFGEGLALAGFDVAGTVQAGSALPVTLYWQAAREVQQDYLVSLCLHDDQERPVACWRGGLADGAYPARAWEAGDTLADTVFIPIPACYRLPDRLYRLHLELWPLDPTAAESTPLAAPVIQQTLAEPTISIRPAGSLEDAPQRAELWQAGRRLGQPARGGLSLALTQSGQPVPVDPGQSLAYLAYATGPLKTPVLVHEADPARIWRPAAGLETPLFLPCDDGPTPFATLNHFLAGPTLAGGTYRPMPETIAGLSLHLEQRSRVLAPLQSAPVFTPFLAPLALQLPGRPALTPPALLTGADQPAMGEPQSVTPGETLPVTVRWQARAWMAEPLVVSLKLLDKDFQVGGERVASLGNRYPNVLWAPGEIVEETYPVRLASGAPPGLYRLEFSLLRQDKQLPEGYAYLSLVDGQVEVGQHLYPAVIHVLDPATGRPPGQPLAAQLGPAIRLVGYDFVQAPAESSGAPVFLLALYWQSTAKVPADYTVFTQLVGPDGQVWAQWDNPPQAGRYPTTAWAAQDTVVDRYTLALRAGAPPGAYRLLVGMYDPATGQRLPVMVGGQPQADNAVEVRQLTIFGSEQ